MPTILRTLLASCLALLLLTPATAGNYRLVTLNYPPYEYAENNEAKGIAVDIVKEAFRMMGHKVSISVYPMRRSLDMLRSGEADGIFTEFHTAEREQFITYSNEPILQMSMSLWVRQDASINFDGDLEHLAQYRFGAVRGISYGNKFDDLSKSGRLIVEQASDLNNAIQMALAKRFDILVSNHYGAIYEMQRAGVLQQFKALYPFIQEQETHFGFAKKAGYEILRDDFDKNLRILKQNGFYEATLKKYRVATRF